MTRTRISFLTLFLILLTAAFVVAVTLRARTYASVGAQSRPPDAAAPAAVDAHPQELHPEVTGTLVPVGAEPSGGNSANAPDAGTTQQTASESRAQRFKELLAQPVAASTPANAPPANVPPKPIRPTPPPAPVKPAPSLLQRIVQPIANALGVGGSSSGGGTNTGTGGSGKPGDGGTKPTTNPDDPTSDSKPPQLLAAEFNPPTAHDAEDAVLYVMASDDISGVRSISGTVTSPGGKALQGFSCQKDGDIPNRYACRVSIPKDAEEGQWRVNFMSLSDNASNTANLHYNQGAIPSTAVLRVTSSRPDNTPPTLRRIWLERRQIKGGEKVQVFVEADDDKSGMKFVSGTFVSPARSARLSFSGQKGDTETMWTGTLTTPTTVDCGDWQLEQVQLQDMAGNTASLHVDNQLVAAVKLTILADSCDNTPPVLQSLVLDARIVTNQAGSGVILTATVSDDLSGISGVMAQATGPGQGSNNWFPLTAASGDNNTVFVGRFAIPTNAAKGVWNIAFVQVIDKANNIKLYTKTDAPLVNATFEVR